VAGFGKQRLLDDPGPDDFAAMREKMARKWGPHRLGKCLQCIRCLFKFAFEAAIILKPMRFGPGFKRPSKKPLRLNRAKQRPKRFTAEETRLLLIAAGTPMKAMMLLSINCGFGNSDCGNLPLSALDLNRGWIDYLRPKTGIERRCPLWTVAVPGESPSATVWALAPGKLAVTRIVGGTIGGYRAPRMREE
jgi:hypothetical protein